MNSRRRIFILPFFVVILVIALTVSGCGVEPSVKSERSGIVFGTVARFVIYGNDAEITAEECFNRLSELSRIFDSEIAVLNEKAGSGKWTRVSPEVWHILSVSQKYSGLTGGAWDATVGSLSSIWKKSLESHIPPTSDEISAARMKTGWQKMELRESDMSARLNEDGMILDLGGSLKGYALDECRRVLAKHNATGLIDLGTSSIAAVGGKDGGAPFRVVLRHPRKELPASLGILNLKDSVISTSGDYEHYFIYNGRRFHHLLDTATGNPVNSKNSSVSVLIRADQEDAGLAADMLSTAFFVMGEEKSKELLASLPVCVEAAFSDENGIYYSTRGFKLDSP